MEILGDIKNYLSSIIPRSHGTTEVNDQTNDDGPHVRNPTTSPRPLHGSDSTTIANAQGTTSIDLTASPTRPRAEQHANITRSQGSVTWRSDDEKRLTGDYNVPSDRVIAPDPHSYFPPRHTMPKPASASSFKPLNTIDQVNRGPNGTRPVKYGRRSGNIPRNHIGLERGEGQRRFQEQSKSRGTTKPRNNVDERPTVQPPKRRKFEHVTSQGAIALSDDEDVQVMSSHSTSNSPAAHLPDTRRISRTSQRRNSLDSEVIITGIQSLSQSPSEFLTTEDMAKKHRRRKAKHIDYARNGSTVMLPPLESLQAGEEEATPTLARKTILQDLRQGHLVSAVNSQPSSTKQTSITSRQFPNARINESTADATKSTTITETKDADTCNLRNHRRVEDGSQSDSSKDELAIDTQRPSSQADSRAVKSSQLASETQRNNHRKATEAGWPLVFARTHTFNGQSCNNSDDGQQNLFLRNSQEHSWFVRQYDNALEHYADVIRIDPQQVIKGYTDGKKQLRLEGSRSQVGKIPVFDLRFQNPDHLCSFRAIWENVCCKIISRDESHLNKLFGKPLMIKQTRESLLDAENSVLVPNEPKWDPTQDRKTSLPIQLGITTAQSQRKAVVKTGGSRQATLFANVQAPSRSLRSTRHVEPNYGDEEVDSEASVDKYSITKGLGQRWQRPLTYGEGRRKATVYFDDLPRLDEEEFLNDSLIDFYMIYLFDKHNVDKEKVFFFNTYFFTQLTKSTNRDQHINYKAVQRWTSKVDIFTYDYIVVPINELTHWYLAIICNVDNIARKLVQVDFGETSMDDMATATAEQAEQRHSPTEVKDGPQFSDVKMDALSAFNGGESEHPTDIINRGQDDTTDLDLIDPEYVGTKDEMGQQAADPRHGNTLGTLAVSEVHPTTMPSNLQVSPIRKKNKRKSMAPRKDPNQPIIIVLDSLSGTRSPAVRALKAWITEEGESRRAIDAVIKEKGFYPKASQIPVQQNYSDCGVYLLGYADKFFENPDEFKRKLLTGQMSAVDDWPNLQPKTMRNSLREIIFRLAEEQKLTEKARKAKMKVLIGSKNPPKPITHTADHSASPPQGGQSTGISLRTADVGKVSNSEDEREAGPLGDVAQREKAQSRLGSPFTFSTRSKIRASPLAPNNKRCGTTENATSLANQSYTHPGDDYSTKKGHSQDAVTKTPPAESHIGLAQRSGISTSPKARGMQDVGSLAELVIPRLPTIVESPAKSDQPSAGHSRHGSEEYPIEIEESQVCNGPPLTGRNVRSPARGRQTIQSPQRLRHVPSVDEIAPPFAPKLQQIVYEAENGSADKQLATTVDEDERHRGETQNNAEVDSPAVAEPIETDEGEEMLLDSATQTGTVMVPESQDVEMMDDREIRETPTPERSSPPWQSGRPLPG